MGHRVGPRLRELAAKGRDSRTLLPTLWPISVHVARFSPLSLSNYHLAGTGMPLSSFFQEESHILRDHVEYNSLLSAVRIA